MSTQIGSSGLVVNATTLSTAVVDKGTPVSITSFTSSGTYTVPSNCTQILVQLVGGGGGSAGYGEGGGAGGFAEGVFTVTPGASVAVTVGGGGGAVGYYAGAGSGGTSSFGSYISATGGYGANNNYSHGGGHGGVGSNGQINLTGGTGTGHMNHGSHSQTGNGGGSYFGGPPSIQRHNPSGQNNYSYAPGSGGSSNEGDDGSTGSPGAAGLVIVYAFT